MTDQKEEIYKNYENAKSQVEKGIFWEHPPQRIVKPKDKKTCWKDHFRMSVFHWIPSAMLGKDWRPHCCGVACKKNGHNIRARYCFGQYENYWLNAPEYFKGKGECKSEYISKSDLVMKIRNLSIYFQRNV